MPSRSPARTRLAGQIRIQTGILPRTSSRCLDPGKYRILDARVEAWAQVLADGLATVEEVPAYPWMDAPRGPDGHHRVRRVAPANQDGLTLVLANTVVDGEPFGLDIGVTHRGMPTVFVDAVPDCGCDACDSGAADLLATLDGCVLNVARGGVVHARAGRARVTQTLNGWQSTGDDDRKFAWLEAALPVADEVERWMGAPWQ